MLKMNSIYAVVEGEPFLSACRDWQRRYREAHKAFGAWASEWGAKAYLTGFGERPYALAPVSPLPAGWKLTGRTPNRIMRPKDGADGAAIRAQIEALPALPSYGELEQIVGCPTTLTYTLPNGHGSCGMGLLPRPVQLLWVDDEHLVLTLPDIEASIAALRKATPDAVVPPEIAGWTMPAGLRRITAAGWKLMQAQAELARERAAEEAAHG